MAKAPFKWFYSLTSVILKNFGEMLRGSHHVLSSILG